MSTPNLQFRTATLDDIPALCALVNRVYRGESSRAGWTGEADYIAGQRIDANMLRDTITASDNVVVISEHDGQIVGCIHLAKRSDTICFAGMLAVATDWQSHGIGKTLMAEAQRRARDVYGCTILEIIVLSIREELIRSYEAMGFVRTGEVRPFPYGDERYGIPLRDDLELHVFHLAVG